MSADNGYVLRYVQFGSGKYTMRKYVLTHYFDSNVAELGWEYGAPITPRDKCFESSTGAYKYYMDQIRDGEYVEYGLTDIADEYNPVILSDEVLEIWKDAETDVYN